MRRATNIVQHNRLRRYLRVAVHVCRQTDWTGLHINIGPEPKDYYIGLSIDNLTFWTKTGFVISRASSLRTLSVSCAVSSKSDSNRDVMGADECVCVSSRKCTVPAGDVIFAQISPASTIFKMCPSAAAGSSSPTLLEISANDHGEHSRSASVASWSVVDVQTDLGSAIETLQGLRLPGLSIGRRRATLQMRILPDGFNGLSLGNQNKSILFPSYSIPKVLVPK